jgi:hypothetical protein
MNRMLVALAAAGMVAGTAGTAMAAPHARPRVVEQAQVPQPGGVDLIALMKQGKSLDTVSCRDFNLLDESFRPQAITYALKRGPKGKEIPTETIRGVENITPVVLGACQARPGDHFTATVRRAVKRNV